MRKIISCLVSLILGGLIVFLLKKENVNYKEIERLEFISDSLNIELAKINKRIVEYEKSLKIYNDNISIYKKEVGYYKSRLNKVIKRQFYLSNQDRINITLDSLLRIEE